MTRLPAPRRPRPHARPASLRAPTATRCYSAGSSSELKRSACRHVGGIAYDENHMLDQIMWMMGDRRPLRTTGFLTNVRPETPNCTIRLHSREC